MSKKMAKSHEGTSTRKKFEVWFHLKGKKGFVKWRTGDTIKAAEAIIDEEEAKKVGAAKVLWAIYETEVTETRTLATIHETGGN